MSIGAFDVCGPLPAGVTVLEASAGTGKTFTIAALATRYVAEGVPLDQLLVVTFTRMATGELRERVRDRLVSAERGLARVAAGIGLDGGDSVLELLAAGTPEEVEERRWRVSRALAEFDAATIATTHGFCQHVLAGLGVAGDVDPDLVVTETVDDLLEDVVDDLYVRRFWRRGDAPFDRREARRVAQAAVDHVGAPIDPEEADESKPWAMRRRLAMAVRVELEARKRRAGVLTYDDLLIRLKETLSDGERGAAACERLRARYRVALVDEFQDTDPDQWDVLQRAFGDGRSTLVLIGDPKQAIYAFRGADVYAYLEAARAAGSRATLAVNYRSDQCLIDAYDALFRGAKLGHSGIAYRDVRAADANQKPGLVDAPCPAPLRLRMLPRADGVVPLTRYGYLSRTPSQEYVAGDLAGDVVRLLSSDARVIVSRGGPGPERWEPVSPGHLAVLVRTHRQAAMVRDALDRAGVQAVINGAGSVFATPVAREWLRLLDALERPTAPARARSAALTVFLGWEAARVAAAGEAEWEDVHARLHRWAGVLRRRGVASLLELISSVEGLPERVLRRTEGERELTDLRHLGQLLHTAATTEQMGPSALTTWLRLRITGAAAENDDEERSRRLESDAEAVQVLTIHRAKGLEFPVVYCPYLWDAGYIPEHAPPVFHDPARADIRVVDVGGQGSPNFAAHWEQYVAELRGEDLRLAYVALTRARHQAIVWWAGSYDSRHSPLGRLLFSRDDDGNVAAAGRRDVTDDAARACFESLAERAPGRVSVEQVTGSAGEHWRAPVPEATTLAASVFGRTLDTGWRRTSYTGLTHAAHEPRVGSEPEQPAMADEPPVDVPVAPVAAIPAPEETGLRSIPCPLAAMAGGADVGTFVHRVLERADFAASDLAAEIGQRVAGDGAARHLGAGDPAVVTAGLVTALQTPLGPLAGERPLCDFSRADRLDELSFEFPMSGGDSAPAGSPGPSAVTVADVAALLDKYLPAGDPLAGYPGRLPDAILRADLRGYLTGSIDLVLRVPDHGGAGRFVVADYKTNWLGPPRKAGDPDALSVWDYRPEALTEAMQRAHYPLQALLYSVALHRYLRWRLRGYDPAAHLGGILYLFLRGMAGAGVPVAGPMPCGVFSWQPPPGLVEALSDLLDGRPA